MGNRGQKRTETAEDLPADKRVCSSLESQTSTSQSQMQTPANSPKETHDIDMETSSSTSGSTRSEIEGETYGSCDSDNNYQAYHRGRSYSDRSKFSKVLSSLTADPEESVQLAALTELCEVLAFCSDSSLSGLMVDSFSPHLVKLATHESNPNIMLLSIRAITYFCDVHPRSSSYLVKHDAVPALCQILRAIEYLDVAEQCFQALEKISREQPLACLQAGAIMAVLNYIDFFSASVQRVGLSTVVNICKKLPSECPSPYMEAVPILCNLLQYDDQQLVESVATCLIRITECVSHNSEMLDALCKHGLVQQVTHLISANSRTSWSQPINLGLIGLVVKLASGSIVAVRTLFEISISSILKDVLSNYDLSHGLPYSSVVDGESNQVHEVLKLLNELLPVTDQARDRPLDSEKVALLTSRPDILQKFGLDLLPVLMQVVDSGVSLYVCYGCLSVISKLIYFCKSDMLMELLHSTNISSFLAGMFTRKDNHILLAALETVNSLLQKRRDIFMDPLRKEGVIFAVNGLLTYDARSKQISKSTSGKSAAKNASRCLCFAFGTVHSVEASQSTTCKLESDSVKILAEHIKCTYFPIELLSPEKGLSDIFLKLRGLSTSLTELVKISSNHATSADQEEIFAPLLQQLVSILSGKDVISTFEFIDSGIVKSLLNYLSNGQYKDGKGHMRQLNEMHIVERRFEVLGKFLLSYSHADSEGLPLLALIQRLQSALSSVENFPVVLSHATKRRSSYATVPNGHATLYPCLRVQFAKEEGEGYLNESFKDIVNVDPFSSLFAIEDYLWSKVGVKKTKHAKSYISSHKEKESSSSHLQSCSSPRQDENIISNESNLNGLKVDKPPLTPSEVEDSASDPSSVDLMDIDLTDTEQEQEADASVIAGCPRCQSNVDSSQKLLFFLDGLQLNHKLTLYQAIVEQQFTAADDNIISSTIWSQVHKITYRRAMRPAQCGAQCHCHGFDSLSLGRAVTLWDCPSIFSGIFGSEHADFIGSSPTCDILSLLKCLECINRLGFQMISHDKMYAYAKGGISGNKDSEDIAALGVSQNDFVNSKLTEKLDQQLRDPLAVSVGSMPYWCSCLMAYCPFVFGFEARCKYFRLAALGLQPVHSHTLHGDDEGRTASGQRRNSSTRRKFLVHRDRILDSATDIMKDYNRQRVALEVQYNEEVGTGLGPTLEFFTLVSREFQKSGLGLWRGDHTEVSSSEGVGAEDYTILVAPLGLFPRPWSPIVGSNEMKFLEVTRKFVLLGQYVAKALQDRRVLDIPFSKAFYKIILGKELSASDVQSFDLELGTALLEFLSLIEKKRCLESCDAEKSLVGSDLYYQGSRIEDLFLEFILPGYPDYHIDLSAESKMVDMSNLEEYVMFIIDATMKSGISRQIEAFKLGFDEVFPIRHIQIFSEEELEHLLCGEHDICKPNELLDHIKFDHGYTASSLAAIHLLEIIQEFDREQQRLFLRFVTGAPRLPSGGLAALNPKLTIVRKHCSNLVDADLPSVMTCANYLKLPPYSSKEIMKEKLLYAITEGQGAFHLS